jgi:hypothetical protein
MPRLPDRFDLWVRRARLCPDPARQLDYVLGALLAQAHWSFLNLGTAAQPRPATSELEGRRHLLVFSDADRVEECAHVLGLPFSSEAPPIISIPSAAALAWVVEQRPAQSEGLIVNPQEEAVAIPLAHAAEFARAWQSRAPASGYWIPNLTSEEEDFWQSHGL